MFNDPTSAAQTLHTLTADPHIIGAAIYDAQGKAFASYQREQGSSTRFKVPDVEPESKRFDAQSLRLFHPIQLKGDTVGTVYIQSDLTEMRSRVRRYTWIMVWVMAGACAAAMLLSMWLRTSISGPVSHLAQVVGVVTAEKNYGVRATQQSGDELGSLIDGFNHMLSQIQSRDSALRKARDELEKRVEERTQELRQEVIEHKRAKDELEGAQRQLMETSRQAGMAEIATNVLHNVGNVLNSVNVSASLAIDLAQKSKLPSLKRAVGLMFEHEHDLGEFLTQDPRGRRLPIYLGNLAEHLEAEQLGLVNELSSLCKNIDHIKDIVAMQQNYAKVAGVKEIIAAVELVEDSLRLNAGALTRHGVEVIRDYQSRPWVSVEKHKVLQILVNVVKNANLACEESQSPDKRVTLRVRTVDERVQITIEDNGVGIARENLTRIFNHGFTTRRSGHGFGLHSAALAAQQLGGTLSAHSEGPGRGAAFTLELPLHSEELAEA